MREFASHSRRTCQPGGKRRWIFANSSENQALNSYRRTNSSTDLSAETPYESVHVCQPDNRVRSSQIDAQPQWLPTHAPPIAAPRRKDTAARVLSSHRVIFAMLPCGYQPGWPAAVAVDGRQPVERELGDP